MGISVTQPDVCSLVTFRGNYLEPKEFCDNEALPGEEFCNYHLPDDGPDRWRDGS